MPLVSVIIPVYNQEKYLEECLASVCRQSVQDIEIICVNDGSTDGSLEILKKYAKSDSRICLLSQENQGAGAARNLGMSQARGKYLSFLDSDDIFESTMLEKMAAQAEKENADVTVCRCSRFDTNTKIQEPAPWSVHEEWLPDFRPFSSSDITGNFFEVFVWWPWDKLFRKSYIDSLGIRFQPLRTTNDLFFVCAAVIRAQRISVVEDVLVHQRTGVKTSLSSTREKSWGNFYSALMELKSFLKKQQKYEYYKKDFINYCLNFTLWHLDTLVGESYSKLYRALKKSWLQDMEITSKPAEFFYIQENFQRVARILQTTPEDSLFQKIHRLEKDNEELRMAKNNLDESLADVKEQLKKTKNQLSETEQQLNKRNNEFHCMEKSLSFRVGRLLTFLPRKVRDAYRR